ncbi:MAG: TIGR03936 family radical SAM-associated protein, partial [Planctomycetota bacterium]
MEAFEECGIDRGKYLSTLPVDGRVPWDHIDCGVEWGFLLKEYRKALKDRLSHPCGKPGKKLLHHSTVEDAQEEKRRLVCFDCGVACDLAQMREQRLRSLEALEARRQEDSPPPPTEQPLEDVISRARERARRRDCARPPLRPEQRRVWHAYRFRLAKVGPGRFVSHLDLVRLLPRAFRRAGLELFYSAGFHPQPVFSFGPPLRLGLAALSELFEVRLCRRVPAAELVVRLNGALPGGLVIRGGHEVLAGAPKLSRMCRWADYLVFLPGDGARSLSPEALEGISVAPNLPFERRRKD